MYMHELKWKVLHVHAWFMLKPYICLLSIRHSLEPLYTFKIACVRACVCVKMMTSEVCEIDFR